jgi:HPt (histidine-containing phosphotransfer) domain-containing protein
MSKKTRLYNLKKLYGIEQEDSNFINDLVKVFLSSMPADAEQLVKLCDEENWEQAYFIAHKMKANIELLGIESIQKEIRSVEKNAKSKTHLNQLHEKVYHINMVIQQVAEQLKEDFNG